MVAKGRRAVRPDMSDPGWSFPVSRADAIRGFQDRLFAEFWSLPVELYEQILADTIGWAEAQPGGLDAIEPLKLHLVVEVF